jgi:transposase
MPAGRPLELTRDHITQAVALLPRTLYLETVADSLGVTRQTFREWLKLGGREARRRERGKPADPARDLHVEFSYAVKKAIADTESDHLSQIQAAGTESWQALAWVLERRFLGKWSLNKAELRELRKRLDELEKGAGGGGSQRTAAKNRATGGAARG